MLVLPQLALAAGPEISSVVVLGKTSTTATIFWTTNTTSDSRVNYGTTTALGTTTSDSSMVTTHFILLGSLTPNITYYFEVESTDGSGTSTDNNGGEYYQFTTLPVTAYSITLNPVCGVCGELIEVGVCGEVIGVTAIVAAAGTYHICWDSLTNVKETFTATTAGSYSLVFYTPEAPKGDHTVYLVDTTYTQKASAIFTVLPSVKITPAEGPVGTTVTLNGYGFAALQALQIEFQDTVITTPDFKANDKGSWTVSYTIPHTPAGGYIFDVNAQEGTVWVNWVSKYFEVTPKITVTPSSGKVGQTINVEGTGFASNEEDIEITFDGEVRKENIYAANDGSWSANIAVPIRTCGRYIIDASGGTTRARNVPDITFTVVPGISVEPISAYVGDTITVAGGGFAPEETGIQIYFDGLVVPSATIAVDIYGCWKSSFDLPASTYGSHIVSASGVTTQPAVETPLTTQARIVELSPVEGAPGDSVSLTGDGFGGNKKLTVTVGGVATTENLQTQSNGNVVISFRVPKCTLGKQTVKVTDGGATAEVDFTVTKKVLPTPLRISPEDTTLRSGIVTFSWHEITGGSGITYTVEISKDSGFKSGLMSEPGTGTTELSYTLPKEKALAKGTYYWRVKAVDSYGNESEFSASDYSTFIVSPIPTWVWVVIGLVVLVVLMVVAYRETKFKVTE